MMGRRAVAGARLRRVASPLLVGVLLMFAGCKGERAVTTEAAPEDPPAAAGPVAAEPPAGEAKDAATACEGQLGALLEEPIEVPEDLRIAARIDLRDGSLAAALGHLEAWASEPEDSGAGEGARLPSAALRPPTVAGFALSQIGFQLAHIGRILGELGIDPPEMLFLQAPDGELIWLWRLPCDHERLRSLVSAGWQLRIRTLVAGALGEPVDPKLFPFDLLFLPGDRLALVPAGDGLKLLRWLTDGGPRVPALGAPQPEEEAPAELLGSLAPAAIRMVLADRVGGTLTLRPASSATGTLRVRAGAEGLEISDSSDSLPASP